jgi:hypothetical protein
MLTVLAVDGIVHEHRVDQDLVMKNVGLFDLIASLEVILWVDDSCRHFLNARYVSVSMRREEKTKPGKTRRVGVLYHLPHLRI